MAYSVHINGDKSGFNSKAAVDKFKVAVKTILEKNDEFNIEELNTRFINSNFTLTLEKKDATTVHATVVKKQQQTNNDNRDLLKAKINLMRKNRTNSDYYKAKSGNVPEDIMEEYTKLKKISKMPVPEPSEILENPEQYKPMLAMVLGNTMMKQLSQSHPYVRYFKLLAEKLGVTEPLPVPTQDYSEMLKPSEKQQVKGNDIKNVNYETDSDTEENQ
jgi:hypothetical protein